MPRLFVAIDLPPEVKDHVAPLALGLPGARWVPRDQLHLTLRFLGDVDGGVGRDVREHLAGVRGSAFRLRLRELGHFPLRGQPRVIWLGADGGEPLRKLASDIEHAVRRAGLPPEGRKFHPHVTLARLGDTPPRRLADWLAERAGFDAGGFSVTGVTLYSSVLGQRGATHRQEATYELAGNASTG